MDTKILKLQHAGFSALEKAKKLLPKDVDAPPQALRCEYPLLTTLNVFAIRLFEHRCFVNLTSAQVRRCSHHLCFGARY
jgi:hypothetical protein